MIAKQSPAKSRDEAAVEKKQDLEKRLQNVKGALGTTSTAKNKTRKGNSEKSGELTIRLD